MALQQSRSVDCSNVSTRVACMGGLRPSAFVRFLTVHYNVKFTIRLVPLNDSVLLRNKWSSGTIKRNGSTTVGGLIQIFKNECFPPGFFAANS